ncbi:MAG: hypothetical protein J2P48_19690 [Alphaproteobacteria bacterium]|nr:hypothetical protein [Alphaproteobacteria bacterium]
MANPGHALKTTKGNEARGIAPKPILPTPHETAMLRRVAAGYCIVTYVEGEPHYAYENGEPMSLRKTHSDPTGSRQFHRLVDQGWLIPDRGDTLFDDTPAQIYRARRAT